ncbi:MAG: GlcG/HbpS family heme-binding protein [Planctomycetota bacterium]|jgi:uncharacterized protein GlcG (DUF336 family)
MTRLHKIVTALVVSLLLPALAGAQDGPLPYGMPIKLAVAKKIVAAGQAEAKKNNWNVIITIVDSGANLVLLERMDNAQIGSIDIAIGKAKTAVKFRRPTKAFQDMVDDDAANLRVLSADGLIMFDGGHPIVQNGKIIGGIGVSGVTSAQDTIIALAGLKAVPQAKKNPKKND